MPENTVENIIIGSESNESTDIQEELIIMPNTIDQPENILRIIEKACSQSEN